MGWGMELSSPTPGTYEAPLRSEPSMSDDESHPV